VYISDAYRPDRADPARLETLRQTLIESTRDSPDGILIVDAKGEVIGYNDQFVTLWNLPENGEEPHPTDELVDLIRDRLESPRKLGDLGNGTGAREPEPTEESLETSEGRRILRRTQPVRAGDNPVGRIWRFRDVTERHRTNERLKHLAYHDQRTELPNRMFFEQRSRRQFTPEESDRDKALFFIDLDRFSRVNAMFGDEVGNILLRRVVERWEARMEKGWFLARTGGDEFCLIVPELTNRAEASSIAETLLDCFKKPFRIQGNELPARASIGIVLFPRHGQTHRELTTQARVAMNQARKKRGRESNYEFFLPETKANETNISTIMLESRLSRAIDEQDLSLAYQPQIELETDRIVGFEALLRWELEDYGPISATTVIPVAEKIGLTIDLRRWVFNEACRQFSCWHELVDDDLRMSVNLSARQTDEGKNLLLDVEGALNTCGLNPSCLELEVTESVALEDIGYARDVLEERRDLDIRVSLDDFGTGQASLSYLSDLPFDAIKIDRAFVKNVRRTDRHRKLLSTIVSLAKKLDMDVISEGVEEQYQLQVLKELDCQFAQGYFIGRPQRVEEIDRYLNKDSVLPLANG
jgi:diguanylate cyclase (GGDEF)-like protein